jgi:argininosuccinate lyase/amino-acid N-acetyltransferase
VFRKETSGPAGTPNAVWSGRLGALDPRARLLNDSLAVDHRLWPEELALTRAYAPSLFECGILDTAELGALLGATDSLERDLESGATTLVGEDVHSAVETELVKRSDGAALRLHTGRSRNDQVATLFRLHVMKLCTEAIAGIQDLERALLFQAEAAGNTIVAGSTHLQPAQPVLLAHIWMAHVAAFERDEVRFSTASEAADLMPLGAGALAGTPLGYDRLALAGRLGFTRTASNSIDAVGDRDFVLEYLNAAAAFGIHLSRLAEDLVLWCSPGFGWLQAPDGFSTGSSLLPQKRNPDIFELSRGKSARLIANAAQVATLLKGLPSSYQKDLQEDKEPVFDTADTLHLILDALPAAIRALETRPEALAASLTTDLLATELADQLVDTGLPFREAHAAVGRLWAAAEQAGVSVTALDDSTRLAISPLFTAERLQSLSMERAVTRRNHVPGTGPDSVAQQIARAEERLGVAPVQPVDCSSCSSDAASAGELTIRPARPDDVHEIASLMAGFVAEGTLLPRPIAELYQCLREFHVAESDGDIVGCAALRILWEDLGEVRSLVVAPGQQGRGIGAALVARVVEDARTLSLPRVIALTRTPAFFERAGFTVVERETLPRKIWTDCIHCPRRHACDEIAVVMDLVPGATANASTAEITWDLPLPPRREAGAPV